MSGFADYVHFGRLAEWKYAPGVRAQLPGPSRLAASGSCAGCFLHLRECEA
jgi:hypothetical protein